MPDITREQCLVTALGWVERNLLLFNFPPAIDKVQPHGVKALAELSLLCMIAYRYLNETTSRVIKSIIDHVVPILIRRDVQEMIIRRPDLSRIIVPAYACLQECGTDFPQAKVFARSLIDSGYVNATEVLPYMEIEKWYFLDMLVGRDGVRDYSSLYRRTFVSRFVEQNVSLLFTQLQDAYAFTHTLFYLSDFARDHLKPILSVDYMKISKLATLQLGIFAREKDWDIVSELLIASQTLETETYVRKLVWEQLMISQHPNGFIPGRNFDPASDEMNRQNAASEYIFKCNYHPTFLTCMACIIDLALNP